MIVNIDVYRQISNSDWIDTDTIDDIQSIQYQSNQWEELIHIEILCTWYQIFDTDTS